MKAQHVLAAFRSFLSGEREHAISVLRQIEAAETNAGRTNVASSLRRLLHETHGRLVQLPNAPTEIQFREPTDSIDSIMISDKTRMEVAGLVQEWDRRGDLQEHGLSPRSRVLLFGPSGNGKTLLASVIAAQVGLPLGLVNYGDLIDSYRGATGSNISKVMKFAQTTPCVLFFDECDSLMGDRADAGSSSAGNEDVRSVNQVLIELDQLGSQSMVIFATNRDLELDSALSRRIQLEIEMPAPDIHQREAFVKSFASRWPFLDYNLFSLAIASGESLNSVSFNGATSFAECEDFIRKHATRYILDQPPKTPTPEEQL